MWGAFVRVSYLWKVAVAAGLAWDVAVWVGLRHPYFAPLAAILCLQVTVTDSLRRGVERVVGIVGGVLLADVTARALGMHGWSIALLVLAGLAGARLFHLGRTAVPQVAVSALLVLAAGPNHLGYSLDRVVNTFIGAALAVLVNLLLLPPDYSDQALRAVTTAATELAEQFHRIAAWLRDGASLETGRALQDEIHAYLATLHRTTEAGEQALTEVSFSWLARRRREKLSGLHAKLVQLRQGYAHAAGVLRTCIEWGEVTGGMPQEASLRWSRYLSEVRDDVLTWANAVSVSGVTDVGRTAPTPRVALHHEWLFDQSGTNLTRFYEGALWNDIRQLIEELRQPLVSNQGGQAGIGRGFRERGK